MRLLVALDNDNGRSSRLSTHFGHCPYFAIYGTEKDTLAIERNRIDHSDKSRTPVDQVMDLRPDAVFTLGMGRRAIDLFSARGISVMTGEYTKLSEVISNLDGLRVLSDGCEH